MGRSCVEKDIVSWRVDCKKALWIMNILQMMGDPSKLGRCAEVETVVFHKHAVGIGGVSSVDEGMVVRKAIL